LDREVIPMADDEAERRTTRALIPGAALAIRVPPEPNTNETAGEGSGTAAPVRGFPEDPPSAPLQAPESRNHQKQLKTAAELAKMIELDLASHPDCPKAGFRVTVYGWPRWRAMLAIGPAAGGVRNPSEWRELTQELAERLRKRYDLAWEE
jgi:hypothetical protein